LEERKVMNMKEEEMAVIMKMLMEENKIK
jgi:hypothetical protein